MKIFNFIIIKGDYRYETMWGKSEHYGSTNSYVKNDNGLFKYMHFKTTIPPFYKGDFLFKDKIFKLLNNYKHKKNVRLNKIKKEGENNIFNNTINNTFNNTFKITKETKTSYFLLNGNLYSLNDVFNSVDYKKIESVKNL
jgi:hypothetical protein